MKSVVSCKENDQIVNRKNESNWALLESTEYDDKKI